MKPALVFAAAAVLFALSAVPASAQYAQRPVTFAERNLGGPRMGVTYIPGNNTLSAALRREGVKDLISQFGWHFEWQVIPDGGGPQFVVQFVPLVAGVEYGKFLLSGTLGLGIRLPSGYEFGLGPNLLFSAGDPRTALMITIGKSIDYSGVSIPINLVMVTNPDGNRFGIMFGYAIGS